MTKPTDDKRRKVPQGLRLIFDFGPLAVFFLAYVYGDFFIATAAFMAALFAALLASYLRTRHLPPMSLVSGVVVAVFGGLTLFLHDESFFRMKPTIIYGIFCVALIGGVALGKPLLSVVLGDAIELTEEGWRVLSLRWGFFFLVMAALNEYVRLVWPDWWVTFKVFGATALTLVFAVSQTPTMLRYERKPDDAVEE
jgi:intracellular septation protein